MNVQPRSVAWWRFGLLKHEYNLLIRLCPDSNIKILSNLILSSPVCWLTLYLSITHHPSSSALPFHPLSPLFHNVALCSWNVNHISVSFIRLRSLLMFSQPASPGATIYTWRLRGLGSGSVFSLFKYTLKHGTDIGWHTACQGDILRPIIMWVCNTSSCMWKNIMLPFILHTCMAQSTTPSHSTTINFFSDQVSDVHELNHLEVESGTSGHESQRLYACMWKPPDSSVEASYSAWPSIYLQRNQAYSHTRRSRESWVSSFHGRLTNHIQITDHVKLT